MDGSVVGCGCVALMIHVIYKGRALPLAWRVRQGPKGHFPEALHIALVELVRACLPEGTPVVLLGACPRISIIGLCTLVWHVDLRVQMGYRLCHDLDAVWPWRLLSTTAF
jgi:hypothetical protein